VTECVGVDIASVKEKERDMVYRGRVEKGVVVFDERAALEDGTEVSIRPVKPRSGRSGKAPKPQSLAWRKVSPKTWRKTMIITFMAFPRNEIRLRRHVLLPGRS
jgi:hypothetical protein